MSQRICLVCAMGNCICCVFAMSDCIRCVFATHLSPLPLDLLLSCSVRLMTPVNTHQHDHVGRDCTSHQLYHPGT